MSHLSHAVSLAQANTTFRTVLFTGKKSQLVMMDIKPGEDIGLETHATVEQTLYLLSGTGTCVLDGQEQAFVTGDVLVVTPGTAHNVINTGTESLKILTVYTPANHIDGTIHATKADAVADTKDEAFGESVT